jgi:hypothetical protein
MKVDSTGAFSMTIVAMKALMERRSRTKSIRISVIDIRNYQSRQMESMCVDEWSRQSKYDRLCYTQMYLPTASFFRSMKQLAANTMAPTDSSS